MKVIEFLRANGGRFEALTDAYGIICKRYEEEGLVVLNYNQIESPKMEPIVGECRGLILDANTLDIVCRPFDRFFNYGEAGTEKMDFTGYTFHEKKDGSLIKVYYWNGAWRIATRGTAFAESNVGDFGITFEQLVLDTIGVRDMEEFSYRCDRADLCIHCTYLFELQTPQNRVVTRYPEPVLTLLAFRDNDTVGEYGDASIYSGTLEGDFWVANRVVGGYTIDEMVKQAAALPNLEEGYVGYDSDGVPRVKVKSPAYVAVHHIRGEGLNVKRSCELVLTGEVDEYLTYFPEDEKIITPYVKAWELAQKSIASIYEYHKDIVDQKEFALAIQNAQHKGVMFTARKFGISIHEALERATITSKIDIIKFYMEAL